MSQDAPLSRLTYPALDGLRGIAVLLVMVHNLSIIDVDVSLVEKLWIMWTDSGWIGVQLFFVLSGFLITGILLDDRASPRYYKNFYIRRAVRIFPLYYLTLAARFLVVPWFFPNAAVEVGIAMWFVLYLQNWSVGWDTGVRGCEHFWSLAVEEQFYLVWPLAVRRLGARGLAWCCVAIIAVSAVARGVVYAADFDPHWLYMSTLTRADALAFGALVALAIRAEAWHPWLARNFQRIALGAIVLLGVVMIHAHGLSRFDTWVELVGYTAIAVLFSAIVAGIALDPARAWPRFATLAPLRAMGKYSYAAYVFHLPIKVAAMHFLNPWMTAHGTHEHATLDMVFVGANIAVSFGLAVLSYAILERPLMRLKDRWAPR